MNHFDQMQAIVDHARAWGIDDHAVALTFGKIPELALADIPSFQAWARHLLHPTLELHNHRLEAFGLLMHGQPLRISTHVEDTHGLGRNLTLGHLDLLTPEVAA